MQHATEVTCFRGARWIVAWNESEGRIGYRRDGDLAVAGDQIVHVGGTFPGRVDREIDASGLMLMPGLINTHLHSTATMIRNGLSTDGGGYRFPYFYLTQRVLPPLERDRAVATQATLARLLLGGTTTTMDWVSPYEGWVETLADSGIRAYAAPAYNSAAVRITPDDGLEYEWFADDGEAGFRAAAEAMDAAERHDCGRLSAMVAPSELECCSERLLRESKALADQAGRPFQVHAAEAVREFFEIARRHHMTPIQWCSHLGLLGERSAIGHAVYLDHHSKIAWPTACDLDLLASSGTTVTHTPTAWAAVGDGLETLGGYMRAGVNIAMGNDAFPHGLIDELKVAILMGRVKSGKDAGTPIHPVEGAFSVGPKDVLEAATVGGARYLGRPDLGRLAVGCKADLFTVDVEHPDMMPGHDPVRSLIYSAGQAAIRDVYVNGRQVVRDRELLTIDVDAISRELAQAQRRLIDAVPLRDGSFGRSATDIWPRSIPIDEVAASGVQ
jgi:cytosine/adenosine deaminase-related metal-dependent hydrolase